MSNFFETHHQDLIEKPNGNFWWHSMPLPDGNRIAGAHADRLVQIKLWENLFVSERDIAGKRVLDIGANDGFFTIGSLLAGAGKVTAINTADWKTYPENLKFASHRWNVSPEIIIGDFQSYPLGGSYDIIFFLGVLYHLPNVFAAMERLRDLSHDGGVLYVETQMSQIQSALPLFESASDIYPTIAVQNRKKLHATGISNFLFPNEAAMHNLAFSYGFECEKLEKDYTRDYPSRGIFKLIRSPG